MTETLTRAKSGWLWMAGFLALTAAVYWPGLHGGFIFDDFPNIIENPGVRLSDLSLPELVRAALSSPSSEFKRPLASLTFALNYYCSGGFDPFWMKATNLALHLLNGMLVFLLSRALLQRYRSSDAGLWAAWIAGSWLLLPINLTAVLYVVQRMESLANVFVLLGLLGYLRGRQLMDRAPAAGLLCCSLSLLAGSALGLLGKETAVLLPLYAFAAEYFLLGGLDRGSPHRRIILTLFGALLFAPLIAGSVWLAPGLMNPATWATRDFSLAERLMSEARIVIDYIRWSMLPTTSGLSFYHDAFEISRGLLAPWTTLPAICGVLALGILAFTLRQKAPLVGLGIALYFCGHSLTATVLPLELIFEHRNYFPSYGLLLALFATLAMDSSERREDSARAAESPASRRPARTLAAAAIALIFWGFMTLLTSAAWGDSLRLAMELAARAPDSPRAQYELGKTYVVYSQYEVDSPFVPLAYGALAKAASLNNRTILPEQAMVYLAAKTQQPIKDEWWTQMETKLRDNKPAVENDSSLMALTRCARDGACDLPKDRMVNLFLTSLEKPRHSARLLAAYSDYAWNVLKDQQLAEAAAIEAANQSPAEPAYVVTLAKIQIARGKLDEAGGSVRQLKSLNYGGRLDNDIAELNSSLTLRRPPPAP